MKKINTIDKLDEAEQTASVPYSKKGNKMFQGFFILYSVIVLFLLVFQRLIILITDYIYASANNVKQYNQFFFHLKESNGYWDWEIWKENANVIPFHNIFIYLNGADRYNTDIIIENLLGNVLIFLPLGIFLPLLFKKYQSLAKTLILSVSLSLIIEAVQILGRIGQFDINDIILNTFGCLLGHLAAMIFLDARSLLRMKAAD